MRRLRWKHVIREAHRQWARRMALGGSFYRCRAIGIEWSDFSVVGWWNRRRFG